MKMPVPSICLRSVTVHLKVKKIRQEFSYVVYSVVLFLAVALPKLITVRSILNIF
jgi:hypothetical protein